jgi:hypothetical protein
VVGRVVKIEMIFYSSRWESSSPGRVAYNGGADSILLFQLKRGGDRTKRCPKMKRRQWARLDSMGRKCNRVRRRDDVGRRRCGIEEGKGRRRRQLD